MLLIIEALFIVAALGQDRRAAFEDSITLDMATNSVDDQYYGCRKTMSQLVEAKYLEEEFENSPSFKNVWKKGANVTKYSMVQKEEEVLIPPFEKFNVTEVKTRANQPDLWCEKVFVLKSTGIRSDLNCALFSEPTKTTNMKNISGVYFEKIRKNKRPELYSSFL
ncbi:NAD(P)(+)--arginine ADP-ribosyltransferase 2-like [Pimephales promelas]|nr:NAD(P)(+)--arginine ADP-ribosyltransferase 2-like [Pimephales promelas]